MNLQEKKISQHRCLIESTLNFLNTENKIFYSDVSTELVLATGVHEGRNFDFMKQIKGPARSYYQVEPATANDNWKNWLYYNPKIAIKFLKLAGETLIFELIPQNQHEEFIKDYIEEERYKDLNETVLIYNEAYAIAHCRLKYYRSPFKMPEYFDIDEMAIIWKKYYNSCEGAGNEIEFKHNYTNFVK